MIRAVPLLIFAIIIDGLQALISMGLASIAALPGTIGGGALGCLAGNIAAGKIGCYVLGAIAAVGGTAADPILAPATIPIGIALGFAVNICLSLTFGAALVFFMALFGYLYPKYLFTGIGELIPGVSNIPFWTGIVILSILTHESKKSGKTGLAAGMLTKALSPTSMLGAAAGGVSQIKTRTQNRIGENGAFNRGEQERDHLPPIGEGEDGDERRAISQTRTILTDIRTAPKTSSGNTRLPRAANDNDQPYAQAA